MPDVQGELKQKIEDVQLVLQYLSDPENLTSPDSEHIRAILAQHANDILREIRLAVESIPR